MLVSQSHILGIMIVLALLATASKIRDLGWTPEYSFEDIIKEMVDSDLKELIS